MKFYLQIEHQEKISLQLNQSFLNILIVKENSRTQQSISLIGMAGAGKSSVARKLAQITNFEIIDSDTIIETQYKVSLQEILDKEGYLGVREIEEKILLSINFNTVILSTGGSAVYSERAMEYLMQNSIVFFLEAPFQTIIERVNNFSERGFAKSPNQSVQEAFEERESLYKKYCHHIVDNSYDIDSCVEKILKLIK